MVTRWIFLRHTATFMVKSWSFCVTIWRYCSQGKGMIPTRIPVLLHPLIYEAAEGCQYVFRPFRSEPKEVTPEVFPQSVCLTPESWEATGWPTAGATCSCRSAALLHVIFKEVIATDLTVHQDPPLWTLERSSYKSCHVDILMHISYTRLLTTCRTALSVPACVAAKQSVRIEASSVHKLMT